MLLFSILGCKYSIHKEANGLACNKDEVKTLFPSETIFVCIGYLEDFDLFYKKVIAFLKNKNAKKNGDAWVLNDEKNRKSYVVRILTDITSVKIALRTAGSHVILRGHANYGLGPVFLKDEDKIRQNKKTVLDAVKYIDDERILHVSSKWIDLPISKLRKNNKLSNWWPIYQDGTSGITPYEFDHSGKQPAYNYYLSYQVPGDPNYYKILDREGHPIERFPRCGKKPWFSKEGKEPEPSNPSHQKYFIINNKKKKNYVRKFGGWRESKDLKGFYDENYLYALPGSGKKYIEWHFEVSHKGKYTISTWWPSSSKNASNVEYSLNINHHGINQLEHEKTGSKSLIMEAEYICNPSNGCCPWNKIFELELDSGAYVLTMTPCEDEGYSIADAIRIEHVNNPESTFMPFFFADKLNVEVGDLVTFSSKSKGDISLYKWNFGDGSKVTTHKAYMFHRYKKPGIYDVSLTISDYRKNQLKKHKKRYIAVDIDNKHSQPEFSTHPHEGALPLKVKFKDRSIGKIKRWHWDFGDGNTSSFQNPEHTYLQSGKYTVSLTILDEYGIRKKYVKKQYVKVYVFDAVIDNMNYPKSHYSSYTIINGNKSSSEKEEYRYKRLFFDSCKVERYFLDEFNQGIVYYTKKVSNGTGLFIYLESYLNGDTDKKILKKLDKFQSSTYDFVNFSTVPH
jgi:PKD repeat protein